MSSKAERAARKIAFAPRMLNLEERIVLDAATPTILAADVKNIVSRLRADLNLVNITERGISRGNLSEEELGDAQAFVARVQASAAEDAQQASDDAAAAQDSAETEQATLQNALEEFKAQQNANEQARMGTLEDFRAGLTPEQRAVADRTLNQAEQRLVRETNSSISKFTDLVGGEERAVIFTPMDRLGRSFQIVPTINAKIQNASNGTPVTPPNVTPPDVTPPGQRITDPRLVNDSTEYITTATNADIGIDSHSSPIEETAPTSPNTITGLDWKNLTPAQRARVPISRSPSGG